MDIFEERGVTPEVAATRPYIRYEKGEVEPLLSLSPAFRDSPAKVKWRTGQHGGWVMMKTPVPGVRTPIIPQFRPDKPLITRRSKHDHADLPLKSRAEHVQSEKHAGIEAGEEHEHVEEAKYMLWPAPRLEKDHVHGSYKKEGARARHVEKYHSSGDVPGTHHHVFSVRDPDKKPEKRLDMHPASAALLPSASRIFFALEGVLKADALLSVGECAFDVPSVTLWGAPELPRFAKKYLRDREVYVVPDSDWATNPEVALQAFEAADFLRSLGALAQVAAPTPSCGRVCACKDGLPDSGHKRGVDDYIAQRGSAAGLIVLRRNPSATFEEWALWDDGLEGRSDRWANDVRTMEWLTLRATSDGLVKRSAEVMARYVGDVDPRTISNVVNRLIESGALERVDAGSAFAFRDARLRVVKGRSGRQRFINTGAGWQSTPTFHIRPDLRADSQEEVMPELS